MILFDIIQNNEEKAKAISEFLVSNKYAVQTHIDTNNIYGLNENKQTIRLFFVTKALLYSEIEKKIKEHFYSEDLLMFATPISHINEEFGALLREKIKSI